MIMNELPILPKTLFQIFGSILIIIGIYFTVKIYPFAGFRNYTYISEKERGKRSLRAGLGAIIFIFGFLFLVFPMITQDITIGGLLLQISGFGLCISPIVGPVAFFRMYRDLWTYTKTEGDIVFTNEDKSTKN